MSRVYICLLSSSFFFFFKQKTAYEMRISDWSSDVCSSDLAPPQPGDDAGEDRAHRPHLPDRGNHRQQDPHRPVRAGPQNRRELRLQQLRLLQRKADRPQAEGGVSSEGRRGGEECGNTCRSRWSPYSDKTKQDI